MRVQRTLGILLLVVPVLGCGCPEDGTSLPLTDISAQIAEDVQSDDTVTDHEETPRPCDGPEFTTAPCLFLFAQDDRPGDWMEERLFYEAGNLLKTETWYQGDEELHHTGSSLYTYNAKGLLMSIVSHQFEQIVTVEEWAWDELGRKVEYIIHDLVADVLEERTLWEYGDGWFKETLYLGDEEPHYDATYFLDSKGNPQIMEADYDGDGEPELVGHYEYDEDGHLTMFSAEESEELSWVYTYEWQGDLLVRVEHLDALGNLLSWENYSYDECGREIMLEQPVIWQHRKSEYVCDF